MMANRTYLAVLLCPCGVFLSLFSVLSGRPFVASGLDMECFCLFNGLGVPGPFTFLKDTVQSCFMHIYIF